MSTTLTPATPPTIPTSLTGPADTEACNAASVNNPFQSCLNGVEGMRQMAYGGGVKRRVTCTSGTNMVIQPLGAVLVTVGGVWEVLSNFTTASTINPTTLAGGSFANSTRYYVYAYDSGGGTLAFAVSTSAPDAGLRYMSGDTTKFFVTTFLTSSSGTIYPYTQVDGYYSLHMAATVNNYPVLLNGGSATAITAVAVGTPTIPGGATSIGVVAYINSTSSGRYGVLYQTSPTNYAVGTVEDLLAGFTLTKQFQIDLGVTGSFSYLVSHAASQLTVVLKTFTI